MTHNPDHEEREKMFLCVVEAGRSRMHYYSIRNCAPCNNVEHLIPGMLAFDFLTLDSFAIALPLSVSQSVTTKIAPLYQDWHWACWYLWPERSVWCADNNTSGRSSIPTWWSRYSRADRSLICMIYCSSRCRVVKSGWSRTCFLGWICTTAFFYEATDHSMLVLDWMRHPAPVGGRTHTDFVVFLSSSYATYRALRLK